MYKAEILADSLSPQGNRLTTMKITFPRFILAEMNTHRVFSRNSASSRAIPFKKMVKMVEENPFIPIAWQKDHKGMQGTEYIEEGFSGTTFCEKTWLYARDKAIQNAKALNENNVTKQLCNRLLEPFMWHTVIVSATEWENFFKLRCPQYFGKYRSWKDASNLSGATFETPFEYRMNKSQADIHIQAIAELMWDAYNESTPKQLKAGEWHIPKFHDRVKTIATSEIPDNMSFDEFLLKISTAHCARISYQTLGDDPKIDYQADLKLHDILLASGHMSPFEHCAKVMNDEEYYSYVKGSFSQETEIDADGFIDISTHINNSNNFGWCNNFKGFIQYRYLVEL
jgi:thymidylate synthase ThyX